MWKKPKPEASPPQPAPTPQAQQSSAPQAKEHAMIGPKVSIKGNLTGEEDLLIEGSLEGKIEMRRHSVTIGKKGQVKADIYGKIIVIEGTVEGNLYGEEQLIVRQSGTVRGNIVSPRVALEDGSNFMGSIDMSPKEQATATTIPDKSCSQDPKHCVADDSANQK
jgi:cytoskeletal protein CcmA (bactofilin family)